MMKRKQPEIYAFIDSQNLNLGTFKSIYKNNRLIYQGWKLDFQKFRQYLSDKFRVTRAFLFIGYTRDNEKLYQKLRSWNYILVFKPMIKIANGKAKGNVDAELVLHAAAIEYKNYDKAVFVSGDGDFACLYGYLQKQRKLAKLIIPNRFSESSLLKPFQKLKIYLASEKRKLLLKN